MSRYIKICSTLAEAEMHADYVQLLEGLARKGHTVYTYLHTATTTWNPDIAGLQIVPTKESFKLDRLSVLNRLSLQAAQTIKKHDIDVVYATGTRLGESLVAGCLTGKPVLCDVRNPWSVQWKDFRQQISCKTILGNSIRRLRYLSEEKLIHRANRLVAYSPGIKRWLVDYIKLPAEKITVIPPHVDTHAFHPNIDASRIRQMYDLNNAFVLMYVGELSRIRGIDLLIDSLHLIRKTNKYVKLMLIGPLLSSVGPYLNKLKTKIRDLDLQQAVIFTGYIPFRDIPEYTAVADVCVMPHRPNFTFEISPPVKTVEYMASQKPIVTTDVGIRDFISHGQTGLIVEPENAVALADAIMVLLNDPTQAEKLARNARRFVEKHLRKEFLVDKFEQLLMTMTV